MRAGALLITAGLLAAGALAADADGRPPPTTVAEAFEVGGCNLCHQVPETPPATRLESCRGCHLWIRATAADPVKRAKAVAYFPLWERYEQNVASYLEVPSLEAAMARLEPEWVRAYLSDPHDLRPSLPETMPRLGLSDPQLDAIVAAFAARRPPVASTPAPDPSRVADGAALFASSGCEGCHTFGSRHTAARVAMAPDLAHTRDRMDPDRVAAWIRDPRALSAEATMPTLALSEAQVLALRDYVLLADPGGVEAAPVGDLPDPVTRPVAWAEVEERVFGRICVHCHMKPELNQGRAGPGNAGGFGFAPTGIELQTWEGVVAVADRIPDALRRRRMEAHRDVVAPGERPALLTRPPNPGMPLGLPPLSDEDTALVLGWIAQGTPR